jgi:hypothetical protein
MGQPNSTRIETPEGAYSFTETRLSELLREIDSRLNCAENYDTITRTGGLISKIEIFSDLAKTIKKIQRTYTRTTGTDGVDYITGFVTIFYNANGSEDSRVTTTITRVANLITSCNHVFSTSENTCL